MMSTECRRSGQEKEISMSWKAIQAAREIRLWTVQIVIPAAVVAACWIENNPKEWDNFKTRMQIRFNSCAATVKERLNIK